MTAKPILKEEFRRIRKGIHDVLHGVRDDGSRHCGKDPPSDPHLMIRDIMKSGLVTVQPETPLSRAVTLMLENRISGIPVIDEDGMLIGCLHEHDVLKVFYEPEATTVASVMTRDPAAIEIDGSLVDVLDELMASDGRRVFVHNGGRLVGVIRRGQLMPAVLEALEDQLRVRRGIWTTERV